MLCCCCAFAPIGVGLDSLPLTSICACLTCEGPRVRDQTGGGLAAPAPLQMQQPQQRPFGGLTATLPRQASAETRIANGTAATSAVEAELAARLESFQLSRTPPRAAASVLREPTAHASPATNHPNPFQSPSLLYHYPNSQLPQPQYPNTSASAQTQMTSSFHDRLFSPQPTLAPQQQQQQIPPSSATRQRRANPASYVPHFGHTPRHNRSAQSQRTLLVYP